MFKIGQTAKLEVTTNEDFVLGDVESIDFVLETENSSIHKIYGEYGAVEYDDADSEFLIPIYQLDTINLSQNEPCIVSLEAQINYVDKSVAKSKIVNLRLEKTLYTNIITDAEPSNNQKVMTGLTL